MDCNLSLIKTDGETAESLEEATDFLPMSVAATILNIEKGLRTSVNQMVFSPPVAYRYNPLDYAWDVHSLFVTKYGNSAKKILFVGMNPGPWGMAQTGVINSHETQQFGLDYRLLTEKFRFPLAMRGSFRIGWV